jgi:hypothetical protein
MVKSFMSESSERSPVNKAMLILVDTGILYALFFVRSNSAIREAADAETRLLRMLACRSDAQHWCLDG